MCYDEGHSQVTHSTLEASLRGYKLHFRMASVGTRRKRIFFIVCLLPYLWDIRPLISLLWQRPNSISLLLSGKFQLLRDPTQSACFSLGNSNCCCDCSKRRWRLRWGHKSSSLCFVWYISLHWYLWDFIISMYIYMHCLYVNIHIHGQVYVYSCFVAYNA